MKNSNPKNVVWCRGIFWALSCALAFVAHAQAPVLPAHWMEWNNNHAMNGGGVGSCGITKPLSMEWDQSLQQITAGIASLGGAMNKYAYAMASGNIGGNHRDLTANSKASCSRYPLEGEINLEIWTEDQVDSPSGSNGRARLKKNAGHAAAIGVQFNQLPELEGYSIFSTARMGFYRPTGNFQGYPAFDKHRILITAPGHAPAYIPVSLDAALRLLIPYQKEQVAFQEQKVRDGSQSASDDSEFMKGLKQMGASAKQLQDYRQQILQSNGVLETELKGARAQLDKYLSLEKLGAVQRAAPAYVRPSLVPGAEFDLLAKPEEGAETLMAQNPDYFNDKLPRTDKQVMVVVLPQFEYDEVFTAGGDEKKLSRLWMYQFFKQVDWKTVAKTALH